MVSCSVGSCWVSSACAGHSVQQWECATAYSTCLHTHTISSGIRHAGMRVYSYSAIGIRVSRSAQYVKAFTIVKHQFFPNSLL